MRRLIGHILNGVHYAGPILAVGALIWGLLGDSQWVAALFFPLGFLGMFAGGGAKTLLKSSGHDSQQTSSDALSRARSALAEIEAADEVPGFSLVKDRVRSLVEEREQTIASIEEDGLDPHGLIYLLISNVANELLCSGKCHVYRGSMNFAGNQLLAAFEFSSARMVQLGIQSEDEHRVDVTSLRRRIAESG